MNRFVFGLSLLLCAFSVAACSRTKDPQAGSQTHFLGDCASSCPDPYSCLCGVCTLSCSGSAECSEAHDGAQCVSAAGMCDTGKVCDRECERDADCSALGDRFSCEDGRCRQPPTSPGAGQGGAAGGTAGRGGQSGGGTAGAQGGSTSGGQGGMGGPRAGNGGSPAGSGGSGGGGSSRICALPIVVGPCDAAFRRFAFDASAERCTEFVYGGCEGNGNNFATLADCQNTCGGSGVATTCTTSADCTLIPTGCCAACTQEDPSQFEAVLRSRRDAEMRSNCPSGPPACGPCGPSAFDPKSPVLHARCEAGACRVVDLRDDVQTSCTKDEECMVTTSGCCAPCSLDPLGWVAVRASISAEYPEGKTGNCQEVACNDCVPQPPEAFCADDGHCAIQEVGRVDGAPSTTCFSPNQNLDDAYDPGAVGCDCTGNANGANVCRQDSTGRDVSLTCGPNWMTVEDGACAPGP